jgi:hypothetical protein
LTGQSNSRLSTKTVTPKRQGIPLLDIAEENYGALVHRVYSAGLDRDRWSAVLSDLSTLIGRSWIALHGHDMARNVNLGFPDPQLQS